MLKKLIAAVLCATCAFGFALFAAENPDQGNKTMRTYTFAKTQPPEMDPAAYEEPEKVKDMLAKRAALVRELRAAYAKVGKSNRRAAEIQREMDKLLTELVQIVENDSTVQELNGKLNAMDRNLSDMPLKKVDPEKSEKNAEVKDSEKNAQPTVKK